MPTPSHYQGELDYFDRQSLRGKWLIGLTMAALVLAAGSYLAFHLWFFEGRSLNQSLSWYPVTASSPMIQRGLDWVLWSILGTLIFIFSEIEKYYREIYPYAKKGARTGAYPPGFVEFSPWYLLTFLRGPFISLVILLFFNTANFNLTGTGATDAISFKFSELDHRATLLLAFVLGYYHRVARQVLDDIVAALFSGAWGKVFGSKIDPEEAKLVLGQSMVFKTTPPEEVIWSASLGKIDADGKYTAPSEPEHSGSTAVITAIPKGKKWALRPARITLVPFSIEGPAEVEYKVDSTTQTAYFVKPVQEGVKWSISPADGGGSIDPDSGVYTSPLKDKMKAGRVTITATTMKKDTAGNSIAVSNHFEITLKE
jgi:hypothetical protein